MTRRPGVESEQTADGRRGADSSKRGRAVPAALVVPRVHEAAEPRLDLEAHDVGIEHGTAREAFRFRRREHRRHERRARMRQRHEAHVVIVERVRGRAVGQRRAAHAGPVRRPEDAAGITAFRRHHLPDDEARRFRNAGQSDADCIEHGNRGARVCAGRGRGLADEVSEPCSRSRGLAHE